MNVGDKIKFAEEKQRYTIQALGERFAICTKPFNPHRTVLYSIIDWEKRIRGPENLVFGMGAETREQCEAMLARLEGRDEGRFEPTQVSKRHSIPLCVEQVDMMKEGKSRRGGSEVGV